MARILIVDDSPTQLFAIRRIVEKLGHETITAEDGVVGIGLAKTQRPDLILMDVVMPNLNGFQATRTLKRDSATRHIPVVLVTTKDQDIDRMWGMRQGAKAYITKPFSEAELTEIIKVVLEESPAVLLNTPSHPSPPAGRPSGPPAQSIPSGMPPIVPPASMALPGSSAPTEKSLSDAGVPQNRPPVQNIANPSPYASAYPSPTTPIIPTPAGLSSITAAPTAQTTAPLPSSSQNIFDSPFDSPAPASSTQSPSAQSVTSLTDDLQEKGPVPSSSPKQDSDTALPYAPPPTAPAGADNIHWQDQSSAQQDTTTREPAASPSPVAQDAAPQNAGVPPLPGQTPTSNQISWPAPSAMSKENASVPMPSEENASATSATSSFDDDDAVPAGADNVYWQDQSSAQQDTTTREPAASPPPVAQDAAPQNAGVPPLPGQTPTSNQTSWPAPSAMSKENANASVPMPSEENASATSAISSSDDDDEKSAAPLSETATIVATPPGFYSPESSSESFSETAAIDVTPLELPPPEPSPTEFHSSESSSESSEEDIWGQPLPVDLLPVSEHIPDISEPSLRVVSDETDPILDEDIDSMTWRPPVIPPLPVPDDDLPVLDDAVSSDSGSLEPSDDPPSIIDSSPWPRPVLSPPPMLPEDSPFEEEKKEEEPSPQPRRGGILSRLPWRWNTSVPSSPPPRAPPWTLEPGAPDPSPKRPTDKDKNKKK